MSTQDHIVEAIRDARASGSALRLVSGGQWMDAGRPASPATTLSLAGLSGVVHYEPGDLTLTTGAGITLAELREVTAVNKQWIPLDPFGDDRGTLGATIATASCGPLATGFGGPRDQVLGCTFVSGRADEVRAGGRVVKNVAGFDLTRLMIGAWGTLGAITEVSVRVRALPDVDRTFVVALDDDDTPARAWRWLRDSELRPMAAELLSPSIASAAFGVSGTAMVARFGGSRPLVEAASSALSSLGSVAHGDTAGWLRLRAAEPAGSYALRLSTLPSRAGVPWASASRIVEATSGWASASLGRGVIRCVVPQGAASDSALSRLLALRSADVTCVVERAPATTWATLASPVGDALSRGVRDAFDPARVLNRGILGEPA